MSRRFLCSHPNHVPTHKNERLRQFTVTFLGVAHPGLAKLCCGECCGALGEKMVGVGVG